MKAETAWYLRHRVVADEVRTLACGAQASTDEILEIINALHSGSAAAVGSMESSHDRSKAMRNQVEEVKGALAGINDSVLTITDMTHHIASAAEQQSQTGDDLERLINQFKLDRGAVYCRTCLYYLHESNGKGSTKAPTDRSKE